MNNVEVKVCSWQGHIWSKHDNNLMQKKEEQIN